MGTLLHLHPSGKQGEWTTLNWLVLNSHPEREIELSSKAREVMLAVLCGMHFTLAAPMYVECLLNGRHQAGSLSFLTHSLQQPYELGPCLVFQRGEMRLRDVKQLVPSHSASMWHGRNSNPGMPDSRDPALNTCSTVLLWTSVVHMGTHSQPRS